MRKHYIQTNVHVVIFFSVNISCDAELIDSYKFSVPSDEVLRILKGMQRNDVQQFLSKVVEHFESSGCHHVGNECFEVIFAMYSIYLHVHVIKYFNATSCRNGFSFHNFYKTLLKQNNSYFININTNRHLNLLGHIGAVGNQKSQVRLIHFSHCGDHQGSIRLCLIQMSFLKW